MDHIENLKSTKIWKRLNNINSRYASNAVIFLQEIIPLLDSITDYFPYYTRHDAIHGFNVLKRMEEIVKPNCFEDSTEICFSPAELYLLICSSYAHDLGMTVLPNEEKQLLSSLEIQKVDGWKTSPKLQKELRETHSKRGGEYIRNNYLKLSVPKPFTSVLDKMMKAHNMNISQLELELQEIPLDGKKTNIKQLACVLCAADALEFSDTRVIDGVIERTKNGTTEEIVQSYRENMKHESIGNCLTISNDEITFAGSFDDPQVLNIAYKMIGEIESWLKEYKHIDNRCRSQILDINPFNIQTYFVPQGFDFERVGVKLNKDNILRLISSDSLWRNNPRAVIKELLQNSIEACRYRKSRSLPFQNYSPEIRLSFNSKCNKLIIEDNGCGMDRHIIRNNFLTVGNSRSFDAAYSKGHDSLARFGIGFWSVFTIAKNATIQTAQFELLAEDENSENKCSGVEFDVSIDELKDYTVFKELKRKAGTKIELSILDEQLQQFFNLFDWVKSFLICSDVNISIYIDDHEEFIPQYIKPPFLEDLIRKVDVDPAGKNKLEVSNNELLLFEWGAMQTAYDNLNVSFGILYRKDSDGRVTFMKKDANFSLNQWGVLDSKSFSGVSGFKVSYSSSHKLPARYFRFALTNVRSPKGLMFDLHRNTLLDTPEKSYLSKEIVKLQLKAISAFLNETNSNNPRDVFHLNRQASMPSDDGFIDYTSTETIDLYSDLICYRVFIVRRNEEGQLMCSEQYFRLKDLLLIKSPLYFYNTSPNKNGHMMSLRYPNNYFGGFTSELGSNNTDHMLPHVTGAALSHLFDVTKQSEINLIDFNKDAAVLYYNSHKPEAYLTGKICPVINVMNGKPLVYRENSQYLSFNSGYIQIFKVNPQDVDLGCSNESIIFKHTIENPRREIMIQRAKINSENNLTQFMFIGHSKSIVINEGSALLDDVITLINNNKINELVVLIELLKSADCGNIDNEVLKYFG